MDNQKTIDELAKSLGLVLPDNNFEKNRQLLAIQVNDWLLNNFDKLISVLYRMDVSEARLKKLLEDNPDTDAGLIIADMMIERQSAKIKSRQQYRQRDNSIDEEEKW